MAFNRDWLGWSIPLVTHLRDLWCKPITGQPYHPQTEGKNGRVHQTARRWLRAHPATSTLAELQSLTYEFDRVYNR